MENHMTEAAPLKVHITGVYGLIGNLVYRRLSEQADRYDVYGSGRRTMSSARADAESIARLPDDHFSIADLSDANAMVKAIDRMDAVIHIAAVPDPDASFDDVLSSNIVGTHNVLEACRIAGVRRLVYASSIMVNWGYFKYQEPYLSIWDGRLGDLPPEIPKVTHLDLTRPTEPYSASKVWAESYCRTYFDAHDISTICLRIGYVNSHNYCEQPRLNSVWCSHRDITNHGRTGPDRNRAADLRHLLRHVGQPRTLGRPGSCPQSCRLRPARQCRGNGQGQLDSG
jgi:NAD+ dependent glucose-6-phosphate dehydrogenase